MWRNLLPSFWPEWGQSFFQPSSLLHQGASLPWTIARMRCWSSEDRPGQAAITAARAGSSGTPGALRIAKSVGSGWFSDGKGVMRGGASGPVTTPDCGLYCGFEAGGSEAESGSIPAASTILPVHDNRLKSHDPAWLLDLTKPRPPTPHHPNPIQTPPFHRQLVPDEWALQDVIAAWPILPTEDRQRILAIVQGRSAP